MSRRVLSGRRVLLSRRVLSSHRVLQGRCVLLGRRVLSSHRVLLGRAARPAAAAGVSGGDWATRWAASADEWLSGLSIDWEQTLGRNWLAIAGAIILMLGIGFFLKLSFDNNWINDTARIVLGIVSGVALVGVGEFAQSRVPRWAQPVTASGTSILYLSIYAAFALYQLIRPDAALLLLALVVALAGLLAIRTTPWSSGFWASSVPSSHPSCLGRNCRTSGWCCSTSS